jgi:hypothetical protein
VIRSVYFVLHLPDPNESSLREKIVNEWSALGSLLKSLGLPSTRGQRGAEAICPNPFRGL